MSNENIEVEVLLPKQYKGKVSKEQVNDIRIEARILAERVIEILG
jgi:hypothetical protein